MIKSPGSVQGFAIFGQGISLIGYFFDRLFNNAQFMSILGVLTAVWIIVWLTRSIITRR